jgi:sec-independent protein translocase protein TatA
VSLTLFASRAFAEVVESRLILTQGEGANMGLGIPELIVILFLVILIFGASRLPEIGRGIGKGIKNFKEASKEGRDER